MRDPRLGAIVARFQVPELHAGHRALLDLVHDRHENVAVVLGVSKTRLTHRNPLPFEVRRDMVLEAYPKAQVLKIEDRPSDVDWSIALDGLLLGNPRAGDAGAVLYGSRGSFLGSYRGKLETVRIPGLNSSSGSEVRRDVETLSHPGPDFRTGIVYASRHRYPTSYQAVDMALVREERGVELLLGGREGETGLRFPGGFVDPRDKSLAAAAARELAEETGGTIMTTKPYYLGSFRVDDWRYRGESDQVMTALFASKFLRGTPRAEDDLEWLRWVPLAELSERVIEPHRPLAERVSIRMNDFLGRN